MDFINKQVARFVVKMVHALIECLVRFIIIDDLEGHSCYWFLCRSSQKRDHNQR